MSQKNQLYASLMRAIAGLPVSHLTRQAYEATARRFVLFSIAAGLTHLRNVTDIGGRHFREFIKHEQASDEIGTLQNKASHIRCILRAGGRKVVANAPEVSNPALGIDGRCRLGTKTAMSAEGLALFSARAHKLGRLGMGAVMDLLFYLGLRGNEGIHARPDTLERWETELYRDGKFRVFSGTKGGKLREVHLHVGDRDAALQAIRSAHKIAVAQGGFLVERKSGKPSGGLKQARSIFHAFCNRAGIEPHAARYAFACRQLARYLAAGHSLREALILVSHDLGHGDGRGRWVKSVYTKLG